MNHHSGLAVVALLGGAAAPYQQAAQAQTAQDMVGSWTLVANVNILGDGTRVNVYGANPKGIQIFDSGGHFALITTRPDLPRFGSNNRLTGTAEENAAIVQGSNAFYGTYTVADRVLTHKIEGGTWPAWNGTEQQRKIISFAPDEMQWAIVGTVGGKSEVTSRRLK